MKSLVGEREVTQDRGGVGGIYEGKVGGKEGVERSGGGGGVS